MGAFLEGWRRVLRAPALTAFALAMTFLLALPLGMLMKGALQTHLGASLEADRAIGGWNAGWAAEFGAQAQGLGRTFTHEFLGFGGTGQSGNPLDTLYALGRRIRAAQSESELEEVEVEIDSILNAEFTKRAGGDETAIDPGTLSLMAHRLEYLTQYRRSVLASSSAATAS